MEKLILVLGTSMLLFSAACQDVPKADNADATDAQQVGSAAMSGNQYNVDLTKSSVQWTGTKPVGKHSGTFVIKSGSILVADGNVTGGKFVMDITSLNPLESDSTMAGKLRGHLLSEDFFDVAKYPEASFEITNVIVGVDISSEELVMKDATHTITGNLTLKGVTKSISFPAKLAVTEGSVDADANFNIDRTQWGLNYGNDKSLGDKFINPIVNIELHIVATK